MKRTTCQDCGREYRLSETYKMEDKIYCKDCLERILANSKDVKNKKSFTQQIDPTVCFNCGYDNGHNDLSQISGLPVCGKCGDFFRNRPFPAWIKASFLIVAGLVIFSFAFNFRFIKAYYFIKQATSALRNGNLEKTFEFVTTAAKLVPEDAGLSMEASYFEGLLFLDQEKWANAIEAFNKSSGLAKQGYNIEELILNANIGLSFDKKDYESFLRYALELQTKNPQEGAYYAQVASAYACRYAVTNDNQYKEKSLEYLKKSKELSDSEIVYREYEQRILHRLSTREIIKKEEFDKKFPNGWKEPLKEGI